MAFNHKDPTINVLIDGQKRKLGFVYKSGSPLSYWYNIDGKEFDIRKIVKDFEAIYVTSYEQSFDVLQYIYAFLVNLKMSEIEFI